MLWLAVALGAPPPLYSDTELQMTGPLPPQAELVRWANRTGDAFVLDGAAAAPKQLPYGALLLAWMADQDGGGIVYDLMLPSPKQSAPFSLTRAKHRWELTSGTPEPQPSVDLQAQAAALGMPLLDGLPWEPAVATHVARALSLLGPQERERVRGVGLVRVAGIPLREFGPAVATYIGERDQPRIEVYDAVTDPTWRFVGTPTRPHPPHVHVLLHELAHAMADEPTRALVVEHDRQREAAMAEQKQLNADVDAHNRAIRRHNRDGGDTDALKATSRALDARREALSAEVKRLNHAAELLGQLDGPSPIAMAFVREVGAGVTRYATKSPDEAFAEAFALHRLDPDALTVLAPKAQAWFAQGQHLEDP